MEKARQGRKEEAREGRRERGREGERERGREGRRANDEARLSRRRDPAYVQNDISLVESIKTINNISHDVYTAVVCAKMWV